MILNSNVSKMWKTNGYVTVSAKNFFAPAPELDNVDFVATCPECSGKTGLYRRNF